MKLCFLKNKDQKIFGITNEGINNIMSELAPEISAYFERKYAAANSVEELGNIQYSPGEIIEIAASYCGDNVTLLAHLSYTLGVTFKEAEKLRLKAIELSYLKIMENEKSKH